MLLNEQNFVLADCIDTSISSKKKSLTHRIVVSLQPGVALAHRLKVRTSHRALCTISASPVHNDSPPSVCCALKCSADMHYLAVPWCWPAPIVPIAGRNWLWGLQLSCFTVLSARCFRSLNPSVVRTESALVPIPKRRHGKQNSARFDVLAVSHVFLSYHSVLKVRVAFWPGCSRIKSSGLCGPKRLISNFSSSGNVLNCTLNK